MHDPAHRRELGHVAAEFDALWALTKRNVSQAAHRGAPGHGGLMIKLAYSEARQRLGELSLRVLDRGALDVDATSSSRSGCARCRSTIAAGTSQIQRNIIGERVLGLPREPQVQTS